MREKKATDSRRFDQLHTGWLRVVAPGRSRVALHKLSN